MRHACTGFLVGGLLACSAAQAVGIGPARPSPVPATDSGDTKVDAAPGVAGLESRGQNFLDLPATETSLSASIGATSAQDEVAVVHGRSDGELVLITLENRTLYAQTSADGGATFGPAVHVAGHPIEPRIEEFRMVAAGSSLYIAYLVGDPGGDVGLRLRRSDDMGRTWTFPSVLVARGNLRHGLSDLALGAAASGRVAVAFDEAWEMHDVWAMVSSDSGATWTTPVRLDSADAGGLWDAALGDVHVSSDGTVHAAFLQNRGGGNRVWCTRSVDGGLTFAPERNFDSIVTTLGSSGCDLSSGSDASVLLAFYDIGTVPGADAVHVVRSTDGGASFTLAATKSIPTAFGIESPRPRLLPSPDTSDVLLTVAVNGELRTSTSVNSGASFVLDATAATGVGAYGAARTSGGNYVLGWTDRALQPAAWGASSTNGGVSWNAPRRADQGPGAAAESIFGSMTVVGAETAFLAWRDRRAGDQFDVYAVDAPVSALDFTGKERRADTDWPGADAHAVISEGALVSDGSNVYAALGTYAAGAETMLWVARSIDGGKTFLAAVPVSTSDPATIFVETPRLAALPGGTVYAIWTQTDRDAVPYHQALVFSRSLNFGATWSPATVLVDIPNSFAGHVVAANASAVVALWSDGTDVWARRSTNQGTSFAAAVPLDQPGGNGQYPAACVQGNRIVFAFTEGLNGEGFPYGGFSANSGISWDPPVLLAASGSSANLVLACDPATNAVAAWSDPVAGTWRAYANRLSGFGWSGPRTIGGPPGNQYVPTLAFAGSATWLLGYGDWGTQVFASRSTDGGFNWSAPIALHPGAPQPLAHRELPMVGSDGAGNVWFSWWDQSAGRASLAARHSTDGGLSFGPVRRVDRGQPQGANVNAGSYGLVTLPGVGLFGWLGQRETSYWDIRLNGWSASDLDRDGSSDAADCDDEQPGVYPGAPEQCDGVATNCNAPTWPGLPPNEGNADGDPYLDCADNCPNLASPNLNDLDGDGLGDPCDPDRDGDGTANALDCAPDDAGYAVGPGDVTPVQADKPAASTLRLSWGTVAGATAYDVARGTIAQLRADGSTAGATGVSCSQPAATYSDTKSINAGTANYYLVRGREGVCVGAWGTNSAGTPRTAAACP